MNKLTNDLSLIFYLRMAVSDMGRPVDTVQVLNPLCVEHVLLARLAHFDLAHLDAGLGQLVGRQAGPGTWEKSSRNS